MALIWFGAEGYYEADLIDLVSIAPGDYFASNERTCNVHTATTNPTVR